MAHASVTSWNRVEVNEARVCGWSDAREVVGLCGGCGVVDAKSWNVMVESVESRHRVLVMLVYASVIVFVVMCVEGERHRIHTSHHHHRSSPSHLISLSSLSVIVSTSVSRSPRLPSTSVSRSPRLPSSSLISSRLSYPLPISSACASNGHPCRRDPVTTADVSPSSP